MKRTLAIIPALIWAMSLVACGESTGGEIREPSNVTAGNITEDTQQSEQTGIPEDPEKTEVTISEIVLVDEAGVKITAKSLDVDEFWGPEIKLLIENDSGKDLTFQCRNASVNGYMVETMMSVDVVNGKKANDCLIFMDSDLESCGIDAIADMEFSFYIFDTTEWETYLDTTAI